MSRLEQQPDTFQHTDETVRIPPLENTHRPVEETGPPIDLALRKALDDFLAGRVGSQAALSYIEMHLQEAGMTPEEITARRRVVRDAIEFNRLFDEDRLVHDRVELMNDWVEFHDRHGHIGVAMAIEQLLETQLYESEQDVFGLVFENDEVMLAHREVLEFLQRPVRISQIGEVLSDSTFSHDLDGLGNDLVLISEAGEIYFECRTSDVADRLREYVERVQLEGIWVAKNKYNLATSLGAEADLQVTVGEQYEAIRFTHFFFPAGTDSSPRQIYFTECLASHSNSEFFMSIALKMLDAVMFAKKYS